MSRALPTRAALAALAIATLAPVASAAATTFTPNRLDDPISGGNSCGPPAAPGGCSLRGAAAAAGSGDTIDLGVGVYGLELGELLLPAGVTVTGEGPSATTIAQTKGGRVINATAGEATLSGLTVTGGELLGSAGENAAIEGDPGEAGGSPTGGGILAGGKLTLVDVAVTGNKTIGGDGGKGANGVTGAGGIGGNGGVGVGAGIGGGSELVLIRVAITGNLAIGGDGGDGGNGGAFGNGAPGGKGGSAIGAGIAAGSADVTVVDSLIAGNEARTGAGGDGGDGGSSSGAPGAGGQGEAATGGGFFANGESWLTNVTFAGNLAEGGTSGAGGDAKNAGSPNGANSGAAFGGTGGGASLFNGAFGHFASVTMVGNLTSPPTTGSPGAAFGAGTAGSPGFSSGASGGNAYLSLADLNVRDTILAEGQAAAGKENCGFGAAAEIGSDGHNLQSGSECIASLAAGDLVDTASGTGPLGDNGGATKTLALLPGSAAIDAGEPGCVDAKGAPLATDQRGEPRLDPCDVGAFEVQPPVPVATVVTPKLTNLKFRPAKLRKGRKARISFRLNVAVRVVFRLKRWAPGVKVGGRCVRPANRNGKRCRRLVNVKGAPRPMRGRAGANRRAWRPRKLAPGRYRLIAKPVGGAPRRVGFTVLPR